MPPNPVCSTSLKARLRPGEPVVELTLPNGETLALHLDAAARSAHQILRLTQAAQDRARGPVGQMQRRGLAHPIALARQRWRSGWQAAGRSTRLLVAAVLTPVALGLASVIAFLAIMHLGILIGAVIAAICVCLAPLLAWAVAPKLMSPAELRPPVRSFRPVVVR